MKSVYVRHHGTIYGPYHKDEFLDLCSQNFFTHADTACFKGETEWKPLPYFLSQPVLQPVQKSENSKLLLNLYLPLLLFGLISLTLIICGVFLILHRQTAIPTKPVESILPETHKQDTPRLETEFKVEIVLVGKSGDVLKPGGAQAAVFQLSALKYYLADRGRTAKEALLRLKPEIEKAKADLMAAETLADEDKHTLAKQRYQTLMQEGAKYLSAAYYFEGLPRPLAVAKSDAEGRFSLRVPGSGDLALAAFYNGNKSVEPHYWVLAVPETTNDAARHLLLSNSNHTRVRSRDSLIITAD